MRSAEHDAGLQSALGFVLVLENNGRGVRASNQLLRAHSERNHGFRYQWAGGACRLDAG